MWFMMASWSLGGRLLYPVMAATGLREERSYWHDSDWEVEPDT